MSADNIELARRLPALRGRSGRPPLWWCFCSLLLRWQDRARERQLLQNLDPRMLRDMGMTPDDVARELGKLEWRR